MAAMVALLEQMEKRVRARQLEIDRLKDELEVSVWLDRL